MAPKQLLQTMAILCVAALPALAAPNFTGDWKLNSSKSNFGQMPAPSSMTNKITHADPKVTAVMKMTSDMGEVENTATYSTDGKETSNPGFGGSTTTSTAKFDGDSLVIDTKGKFGDNAFTMKDKWTLSADGKGLTIIRTFKSDMGEGTETLVFDKQ